MLDLQAEHVAKPTHQRCPNDSPESVIDEETAGIETVGSGENSCEGPQYGDEPSKEDDLSAVPQEQVLPDLQLLLVDSDVSPVADQEA